MGSVGREVVVLMLHQAAMAMAVPDTGGVTCSVACLVFSSRPACVLAGVSRCPDGPDVQGGLAGSMQIGGGSSR
jgi:hypothetical protein